MPLDLPVAARRARALLTSRGALLTFGFAALYLATFDSEMGSPDERQRYDLALALARRGPEALLHSGGISKYPPLLSLLAAPLMRLGLWLDGGLDGLWTHRLGLSVSLLACIALVPLFHEVARTLAIPARTAAAATALFGLTNPVWPYSKRFFSEPLTAALAFGAFAGVLLWARRGRRPALVAGLLCLGLFPLNNMVLAPALYLGVGTLLLLEGRRRDLLAVAATGVASAGLLVGTILIRYGGLRTGYGTERFTFDVLDGLHGLLFGWGRSIFVYAPLLLLSALGLPALARRCRGAAVGVLVALAAGLLAVASWWCWWGGICWGPRLVLPLLPLGSIGAAPFLSEGAAWRRLAALLVGLAGLYVQAMGFAFKHDFDIYFWMRPDYSDERKAWFDWDHSSVRRMPRHFREHPWDLSSAFLRREPRGPSVVELAGGPVRAVEIVHRGDALMNDWSIADLWAVLEGPEGRRRVPARALGAHLSTFNRRDGTGALDGDPRTRWSTGRKRLDGDWVRLELPAERADLVRLELEHQPYEGDFPNALSARARGDGPGWTEVRASAATPSLRWSPLIFVAAGLGCLLVAGAIRRAPAEPAAPARSPAGRADS